MKFSWYRLANEQMIKFWWRSGSRIRIRIATLVKRALAEVRTVPVLLVFNEFGLKIPKNEGFEESYPINGEPPYRDPQRESYCIEHVIRRKDG